VKQTTLLRIRQRNQKITHEYQRQTWNPHSWNHKNRQEDKYEVYSFFSWQISKGSERWTTPWSENQELLWWGRSSSICHQQPAHITKILFPSQSDHTQNKRWP